MTKRKPQKKKVTKTPQPKTVGEVAAEVVRKAKPTTATPVMIGARQSYSILGIHSKTLKTRGVKSKSGKYDLAEIMENCGDLIFNRLADKYAPINEDELTPAGLKALKTGEEIRKLKIDNDVKEGILVPADDVAETYSVGIRAMCDVLDGVPSRVKMKFPDVKPALLDAINQELTEARNKAVDKLDELEI